MDGSPPLKGAQGWERALLFLLRGSAIVTGSAILAALLPRAVMAQIHAAVGLGAFPDGPIVEYLARSTSGFYAAFGGMLWLISTDVRRYGPVLTYLLWAGVAFAIGLAITDWSAGMPRPWAIAEGPFVLLFTGGLWMVRRKARV